MLEPAVALLAFLVGLVLMLIPLHMVNIRRKGAVQQFSDAVVDAAEATAVQTEAAAEALDRLDRAHHAVLASAVEVEGALRKDVAHRDGQIVGLNVAHEETQEWANRILLLHDWHIGGKADPHEQGITLVRWECVCGAAVYAPAGSL